MKYFLAYGPEIIFMEFNAGQPISEELLREVYEKRFYALDEFIASAQPGDVLTSKDISIIRIGRVWT